MNRKKKDKSQNISYKPVVQADDYDRFLFSDFHGRVEEMRDLEPMGLLADCFSSFYKTSPELVDGPAKPLFETLYQTLEFEKLRTHTRFSDVISGMATIQVGPELIEKYKKIEEQLKKEHERQQKHKEEGGDQPLPMSGDCAEALAQTRAEMRGVLKEASEKAEEAEGAMSAFGMGDNTVGRTESGNKWELAGQLMQNRDLAKIVKLLGRMKNLAMGAISLVPTHGVEEIVDVTTGNDFTRMVPHELLKLHTNRKQFVMDFYQHNLMLYEKTDHVETAKGPIVMLVDKSPSMSGDRQVWASALALAVMEMAIKQKRAFHFATFGTRIHEEMTVLPGNPPTFEQKMEIANLICNGGGTDFYKPLKHALKFIDKQQNFNKADILLCSDGEFYFKQEEVKDLKESMGAARLQTLLVGPYPPDWGTKELSTAIYRFVNLNTISEVDKIMKSVAG